MPSHSILTYGAPGTLRSDTDAIKNTIIERDENGDAKANTLTGATGLVSQGKTELQVASKTADFTADGTASIYLVDATSAAVAATLPAASAATNRVYVFVKTDSGSNAVTVTAAGDDTINGAATKALSAQYDVARVVSDGSNWYLI